MSIIIQESIIYNQVYKIGCHTEFTKSSINETIKKSLEYGMMCNQFFLGSPKTYKRHIVNKEDIIESNKILEKFPMNIYTHLPYMFNLCGSVKHLAWDGDKETDDKIENIIKYIEYEINILAKLNTNTGAVIHPGSNKNIKRALKSIGESINKINFEKKSMLILENSAGEGTKLPNSLDEIKEIMSYIKKEKKEHIGICIDTCHIFSSGEYNLSKIEEIDRMFKEFEEKIGIKYLKLIHLNDSKSDFKCKVDRHENIGKGYIWKEKKILKYFLDNCKKINIDIVLETDYSDLINLSNLNFSTV
jgi:apurinic endonuclease APN1